MTAIRESDVITEAGFIHELSLLYHESLRNNHGSPYHWSDFEFVKRRRYVEVNEAQRESDRMYYFVTHVSYEDIYKEARRMVGSSFEQCIISASNVYGNEIHSEVEGLY